MENPNTEAVNNSQLTGITEEDLTVEIPTEIKAGRVQLSLPPCAYAFAAPAAAVSLGF